MDRGGRGRPPLTPGGPPPPAPPAPGAPLGAPLPRAYPPPMSASLGGLAALLAPLLPPPHGSGPPPPSTASSTDAAASTGLTAAAAGSGHRGGLRLGGASAQDDEEEDEDYTLPSGHTSALGRPPGTTSAATVSGAVGGGIGGRRSIHERTPLVSTPPHVSSTPSSSATTTATTASGTPPLTSAAAGATGAGTGAVFSSSMSSTPPSGAAGARLPGVLPHAHVQDSLVHGHGHEQGHGAAQHRAHSHRRTRRSRICGGSSSSSGRGGSSDGSSLPSLRLGSEFVPTQQLLQQPSFQSREGVLGLSADVLGYICGFLTEKDLATLASTCHRLRHVVYLSVFWSSLDLAPFATKLNDKAVLRLLRQPRFRRLTFLSLSGCTALTDSFLSRLPELCPRLTHLTLTHCYNFSPDVILAAATSLPSLLRLGIPGGPSVAAVVAPLLEVARARGIAIDLGLNWLRYCSETARSTDMSMHPQPPRCRHAPEAGPGAMPRARRVDARPRTPCWGEMKARLIFSCVAGRDTLPGIMERPLLPAIRAKYSSVGGGSGSAAVATGGGGVGGGVGVYVAPAFSPQRMPAAPATTAGGAGGPGARNVTGVMASTPAYALPPAPIGGAERAGSDSDDDDDAAAAAVAANKYRGHTSDSDDDDDGDNGDGGADNGDHHHHHHHHGAGDCGHEALPHEQAGDGTHFPSGVSIIDVPADTAPTPHSALRPGQLDALMFLSELGRKTAPLNSTASAAYDAAASAYSRAPGAFLHDVPPRGGPFPVRVSYYCVAHVSEDTWDPDLRQCFHCNRIFDPPSMLSEVLCHFCHDITLLGKTSSWVWLPALPQNLMLTDILGKLMSVDDIRHLPRTLRSYGVFDLTLNRAAQLPWRAPADAAEREWRARVDIFGREQARLAAASPVPSEATTGAAALTGSINADAGDDDDAGGAGDGEHPHDEDDESAALLPSALSHRGGGLLTGPGAGPRSGSGSSSVGPRAGPRRPAFMSAGDGVELTDLGVLSPRYTPRTTAVVRGERERARQDGGAVELGRVRQQQQQQGNQAAAPAPTTTGAAAAAVAGEEEEEDATNAGAGAGTGAGHRRRPSAHGLSLPGRFVATQYMTREEAAARGMVQADTGVPVLMPADQAVAAAAAAGVGAGAGAAGAGGAGEVPLSALLAANSETLDGQMGQIAEALRKAKADGRERALLVVDKHHMVRVMADDHHIMSAEAEESLARVDRTCPSLWAVLLPFFIIMTLTLYFVNAFRRIQDRLALDSKAAATYYLDLDNDGGSDVLTIVIVFIIVFVIVVAILLFFCIARCRAACASLFRGVVAVEIFLMLGAGTTVMLFLFVQDVNLPVDAITFCVLIFNVTVLAILTMYLDRVSQAARRVGLVLLYLVFPVVLASSLPSAVLYVFLGCICLIDIVAMSVENGRTIAPVLVPATFQLLYERPRVLYSVGDTRLRAGDFIWFAFIVAIADAQRVLSAIMAFIVAMAAIGICVFGLPYLGVEFRPLVFAFFCLVVIVVCVPDIFAPFKDVVTAGTTGVANFKT